MITDFVFDGQELSGFGYIMVDFNSSSELDISTVSDMSFTDIKSPLSNISHTVATSYTDNLSKPIQIMKNTCDNEDLDITNDDMSELARWLCRKEYKLFKWVDDKDDDEIFYEVKINLRQIKLSNGRVGVELDITANRPFGFTREITNKIINNTSESAEGREILIGNATNSILTGYGVYGKSEQKSYTGKNLLQNTATTQTINGVTFTVNSDGSVTASGTATAQASLILQTLTDTPSGSMTVSGCKGGSSTTYGLLIGYFDENSTWKAESWQTDEEIAIATSYAKYSLQIIVRTGITVNTTFYPMIRKATITDATYEPYVGGEASPNPSYPQDIVSVADDGDLVVKSCGKNLLKNTATSQTINGVEFKVNSDGSVTAKGTATAQASIVLTNFLDVTEPLIVSGCKGGSKTTYGFVVAYYDEKNKWKAESWQTDAEITISTEYAKYKPQIVVRNGATVNHTFYPMLRLASIDDDSYDPHKSTQATIPLTDSLRGIKVTEGGNYTDETGQQWVCDTLEKYADGSGKLVQRVYRESITNVDRVGNYYVQYGAEAPINLTKQIMKVATEAVIISNKALGVPFNKRISTVGGRDDIYRVYYQESINSIVFRYPASVGEITLEQANADLVGGEVVYILAEPIETPLTAEQIAEIEKLQTFEGVTYITNEDDAYQKVTYKKKTKPHSLTVYSDDEGYIYPDVTITIKEAGNLELINSFENRLTYIANCKVGEVITIVGGDTLQILSSDESHDLSNCFNYKFPRLCTKYRNYTNTISSNLACNIEIEYKGIRKVGL